MIPRFASLLSVIFVVVVVAAIALTIPGNLWSLRAERMVISGSADQLPPPIGHIQSWRAVFWSALEESRQGDHAAAVASLEAARSVGPGDGVVLSALAREYETDGQFVRAVDAWRAIGDWRSLQAAGHRALSAKRYDDAVLAFDAMAIGTPEEAVSMRAGALAARGDRAAAISLLAESLSTHPSAEQRQTWLIALGGYLEQDKRRSEAIDAYRQAIDVPDGQQAWRAQIALGRALYADGQGLDVAVAEIQKAIELRHDLPDGYLAIGDLLRREKRYPEADRAYYDGIRHVPSSQSLWLARASSAKEAGELTTSVEILESASERFPRSGPVATALSAAYRSVGDCGSAMKAIESALASVGSPSAALWLESAAAHECAGQVDQALGACRSALALDPANIQARTCITRLTTANR